MSNDRAGNAKLFYESHIERKTAERKEKFVAVVKGSKS